ncbi:uncharacterized protein LOC128960155 [Oppia nitens]|uniref:uncharacterized protein LOC128960155 n=1 Tax=Oppia nitens TaxID=1686743 RepID=UPI0023DB51F8|nr:uncharacterized protein LOC128960155 [Oppia nitens]
MCIQNELGDNTVDENEIRKVPKVSKNVTKIKHPPKKPASHNHNSDKSPQIGLNPIGHGSHVNNIEANYPLPPEAEYDHVVRPQRPHPKPNPEDIITPEPIYPEHHRPQSEWDWDEPYPEKPRPEYEPEPESEYNPEPYPEEEPEPEWSVPYPERPEPEPEKITPEPIYLPEPERPHRPKPERPQWPTRPESAPLPWDSHPEYIEPEYSKPENHRPNHQIQENNNWDYNKPIHQSNQYNKPKPKPESHRPEHQKPRPERPKPEHHYKPKPEHQHRPEPEHSWPESVVPQHEWHEPHRPDSHYPSQHHHQQHHRPEPIPEINLIDDYVSSEYAPALLPVHHPNLDYEVHKTPDLLPPINKPRFNEMESSTSVNNVLNS